MDLLIGLVIWLLKQLFGDTEKPADMDDASRRKQEGARKLPKSTRSTGGAPSLEELLAEVRREADQKRREQLGEPIEPRPTPRVQPVQRPVVQVEAEPEPSHGGGLGTREFKSSLETAPVPEPTRAAPEVIASLSDRADRAIQTIATTRDMSTPRKKRKKGPTVQQQADAAGTKVPAGAAVAEMLQTIRQGTGDERRQIAQQGFVLNEIFGPCRAQKRFAPPRM